MAEEEEEEEIVIMEKEEMSTTTATTFLPQEIVMEILSRLPANSLVSSSKLVCKAWCTTIKDPDFVKMHLNRGGGGGERRISSSNNHHSLICKFYGNELFQLHPPFNYYDGVPPPIPAGAKKLDFDYSLSLNSRSRLIGSCNGLLCIKVGDYDDETIILLNPSTSKYKVLPKEPMIENHSTLKFRHPATYGFGCCCCNNSNNTPTAIDDDEYKVVRIAYFYSDLYSLNPSFQFQIDIYSMSSNSWRRRRRGIKSFPASIFNYRSAIFLSGALHWTGSYNSLFDYQQDALVSFDIRDEDYRTLPWPPCVIVDKPHDKILMNMRGCLGMICYSNNCWDFDVWVMKEYGIRESWTRECVIRYSNPDLPRAGSGLSWRAGSGLPWSSEACFLISWNSKACFLKGDQILIIYGDVTKRMALYDMNSEKIDVDFKIVGVPDKLYNVNLVDYIETLVSLKSSQLPSRLEQQYIVEETENNGIVALVLNFD